jgi:hypothetical protein
MTNVAAIKLFFESDGGRKVTMEEMKALSVDERAEIGKLCMEELIVEPALDSTPEVPE